MTTATAPEALTAEDYSNAMNFLGQNLYAALTQSVEKLPPELRSMKVITQALSAFMANVIYKQFPTEAAAREHMLEDLNRLIKTQLDSI